MPNTVQIPLVKAFMKCWTPYLIKAIVVLGLFYLGIQIAPTLEPVPFVLFWIALSSIGAVGIAYRAIIRKPLSDPDSKRVKCFIGATKVDGLP